MYEPVKEMYRQSMGTVYLARRKDTGEQVVIKLVERGPTVTNHVAKELLIHRKCTGHPFITKLYEVFLTPTHLAIVLEHIPGGDLLERTHNSQGGLPESEARWYFQQLVAGMAYFHSIGVNNREVKLDNKLLSSPPQNGAQPYPTVKIQDFCYSKSEQINSDPSAALGRLPYTAPEVLNSTLKAGEPADVWSLGVVLYKLTTGMYPFERAEDARDARTAVQKAIARIALVDYVIPESLSPDLRDLLSLMLVASPEQRITLTEICEHPWFKQELPPGLLKLASEMDPDRRAQQSEAEVMEIVKVAQQSIRPLNSENIEELADAILDEEEVDDILDELSLSSKGLGSSRMQYY